ncbi:MAG: aminodeoxychorismate synthase component I [Dehalococcoidia bacterium]|nr:aminodeoxychorismate synthase component I [Dehalococcoidia bacterium]
MRLKTEMNRYPLVEEIFITLTAPELFELIKDNSYSFFLDSGMDPQKLGRYSFIGSNPFLVMSSRGSEITLVRRDEEKIQHGNPFDILSKLLKMYNLGHCSAPVPFLGGAVGYLSYDLCHFTERLPSTAIDDLKLPESYFAFYDVVLAFDHLEERVYLIATGFPELEERRRLRRARMCLEDMKDWLHSALPSEPFASCHSEGAEALNIVKGQQPKNLAQHKLREEPPLTGTPDVIARQSQSNLSYHLGERDWEGDFQPAEESGEVLLKSNFTPEEYIKAVSKVRQYIAAGDVFQVNLSQRFEADLTVSPYELYRRLRQVNPAPFASYLNFHGVTIVSASPERFLKVRNDLVETRPIKGTRPRGHDPIEDAALAQELVHSIKDRAENVMIVDLERNDLGRVCRYGTVKVTELAIPETFPTVFHLTSTVIGRLCQSKDVVGLLKATFPGGSITGAPKVRAMEIIDELEPTRRSVYTGSIGYLSFTGDLDINIVIRTFLIKEGKAYFQVGGGIIYDSDPEAEYLETMDKARALIQALKLAPVVVANGVKQSQAK